MSERPIEEVVYEAIVNNETWKLYDACKADTTKQMVLRVVEFLDKIAGSVWWRYDPEKTHMNVDDAKIAELQKRRKQVVKIALRYYITFGLDARFVKNCIFCRKMNYINDAFRDFLKSRHCNDTSATEVFFQKAIYVMREDSRAQLAVLRLMNDEKCIEEALTIALKLRVPATNWPIGGSQEMIEVAKRHVEEWNKKIEDEQVQIENGFNLMQRGVHLVRLVNSEETVNQLLRPFFSDPTNEYFGFDAEWDMAFDGRKGHLCLLQFSSPRQTMLVDIYALKTDHAWNEAKFLDLFKLMFDHGKPIYGFALISDFQAIAHNFPILDELLARLQNFVCFRQAFQTVLEDDELCTRFFGENPPVEPQLSHLALTMLKVQHGKDEQQSVWSIRPLRRKQQIYAAQDSYLTMMLRNFLIKKLSEEFPHKLDSVIKPFQWTNNPAQQLLGEAIENAPSNGRKTKSSHISEHELKAIVSNVNELLEESGEPFADPNQEFYIVDTMCGPLGSLLRRLGISAFPGNSVSEINELATKYSHSKVLTAGKACKKYPYANRVLSINAAHPVDNQLRRFLLGQRLYVTDIKPRCGKCNGNQMVYIPALVLRYIHYRTAALKGIEIGGNPVGSEELNELREQMSHMDPLISAEHHCTIAAEQNADESDLIAVTKNAILYLDQIRMHRLNKDSEIDRPEELLKIQPSMHLLYDKSFKYSERTLYAICWNCGKENSECTIKP